MQKKKKRSLQKLSNNIFLLGGDQNDDQGSFQRNRPQIETNMGAEQAFLLSRLPLMDFGFQQRVGIYAAAEKVMANLSDLNENQNNAIRLLGYDTILQPTLFFKLVFVMIFGMNAPGKLKWAVLFFLVTYYFQTVYSLYIDHFEQQRRLLALTRIDQQENPNPNPNNNLQGEINR